MRASNVHPSRRRWLWLVAAVLGLMVTGLSAALVLWLQGLETAADIAQVLSVAVPLFTGISFALAKWRRTARQVVATPDEVATAKQVLGSVMAEQWRTESRLRALDDPDPIPVRWKLTENELVMDVPANRTLGVLTIASSADIDTLIEEFRKLRRRRLVILGDAGSGKTTLAVQMLLALLGTQPARSDEPVPVLLSVSGWDIDRYADLYDWVTDRLVHEYSELAVAGLPHHAIRALARQGHLLPILDGLDEAPRSVRERIVDALNKSMTGSDQLILTSRTEAFAEAVSSAGRTLSSAVVLEPEPLTPEAAADYLERCLPPRPGRAWLDVLDLLRGAEPGSERVPLTEVTSSALGLWLVRIAYIASGTDPSPLVDPSRFATPAELRSHLFDRLIEASISTRPPTDNPSDLFRPRNRYEPRDVERWLRFLAMNLSARDTRDFDWASDVPHLDHPVRWPAHVASFLQRQARVIEYRAARLARVRAWLPRVAAVATVLFIALVGFGVISFAVGIVASPFGADTAWRLGFSAGAIVALSLLTYLAWVRWQIADRDDDGPLDWFTLAYRSRQVLRIVFSMLARAVTFGVAYGVVLGLSGGLAAGLVLGGEAGLRAGLVAGGATALIAAVLFVLDSGQAPGSGLPTPWYGISPGAVGEFAFFAATLAAISATVGSVFGSPLDDADVPPLLTLGVLFGVIYLSGVVAFLVLAAFAYAVSSPLIPVQRWLMRRSAGVRPSDGRDSSFTVWRTERIEQIVRLTSLGVLTALVSGALALGWFELQHSPWRAPSSVPLMWQWVTEHVLPIDLGVSVRLSYLFAGLVALGVLVLLPTGWHWWVRALSFAAAGALIVILWPSSWLGDPLQVRLSAVAARDLVASIGLSVRGELAGRPFTTDSASELDFGNISRSGDARTLIFVVTCLLGVILVGIVLMQLEGFKPKTWWSNMVAGWWPASRGRLPRDLMTFLDDAHRLGLLRAVGTVYQLRHAGFQDHLAASAGELTDRRVLAFTPTTLRLVDSAAGGDRSAAERLAAIARWDPARLQPHHARLLDAGVLEPPVLFAEASDGIVLDAVRRLEHASPADAERLLRLIGLAGNSVAIDVLAGHPGQARAAGLIIAGDGSLGRLWAPSGYPLLMANAKSEDKESCPWCDSPLWTILDVLGPGNAALRHAGWTDRLRVTTCHACARTGPLFTEVTEVGRTEWAGYNAARPDAPIAPAEPPPLLPSAGHALPTPYLADARNPGGSMLGGLPDWLQEPDYPDCPACGQAMHYLGLVSEIDLGTGSGAYYLFLDAPCALAAVTYQRGSVKGNVTP